MIVNMADDSGTPTKRFSDVCSTCNSNIILKTHPLDLFGDKAKDERIVAHLEKMFGLKITRGDGCHHVHVGPVMFKYQKFRHL